MTMKVRDVTPTAENSTNFNIVPDVETVVGTTLDNLKSAVAGETGACALFAEVSRRAKEAGSDPSSRQIHIKLEVAEIQKKEPDYVPPEAPSATGFQTDINLISGAMGEIYETSDMYPNFIKVAIDEGETGAELVFTRAKLAEAVHAELYMDAYNNIDAPDDRTFYLCPVCGYIHKGDDFEKCPICFAPKSAFKEF